MPFIDRENEIAVLEEEYRQDGASFVVLYGRRRVGKSELLKEFIKGKRALYYLATEESEVENRSSFQSVASAMLNLPLLEGAPFQKWEDAFRYIVEQETDDRIVIVIDEFQYLGKVSPAFPSVMQRIWDTVLKGRNVMLILCGSLISMMISQTLSYDSPLYGRRTRQIRLGQIPFAYYHEFYEGKSRQELIELYSVTGGVPKYVEQFKSSRNIYEAIQKNVLEKSSYLYDEPYFLLQNEVKEIGSYFSIIKSIAFGNQKLGNIAADLEIKRTSLTVYLKTLIDLGILEREVPVTEESPEKSRRGLYKIKDNFIEFWFRFVFPNKSFIESGHVDLAMRKIRANLVDNHIAHVYENVCRERLWELNGDDAWPFIFLKAGRWWDNHNNEIDVVATDPDEGNIILGECKYWKGEVGVNVLRKLEEKAALVDWRKGKRKEWFVLFSIHGFTEELRALAEERDDLMLLS
ncbi:ATP-binding protein [Ellagibacter isourolithinifaciens]|uniref:ATP-binding protein n=2 Tax=Ellagibacter isourolithinifaciens TaxID=2137581 RepID=A0A6N6NPH2_9ACTN|nr:ATP-binding protein [Ellagibacter isourolithinifaciens]KAB1636050.1 ATP-binding protein [Ellagibacter isourolithinifaciens]